MYRLPGGIKRDPVRRWRLTDRVFFGHGACHTLAGVYLAEFAGTEWSAFWICPEDGLPGYHVIASNGASAFDYHGYSTYTRLLEQHAKGWRQLHPQWRYTITRVDFNLLDQDQLNARKMLGPDQYLHDPRPRARRFIERFERYRLED